MDYKKKYEDALSWMRDLYPTMVGAVREDAEHYFPELAESEDEKIRKVAINCVNWFGFDSIFFKEVAKEKVLSWLEKQKEQKPAIYHKFKVGDTIHKIGENTVYPRTIEKIEDDDYVCNNDKCIVRIKFQDDYELVEQNAAEWSEEDEQHFDSIIESYKELIKDYSANHGVDYIPYNTPVVARTVVNDIKFLKSLRPQPHWKPSKEQMEALNSVANFCDTSTKIVKSLYNDLEKLM